MVLALKKIILITSNVPFPRIIVYKVQFFSNIKINTVLWVFKVIGAAPIPAILGRLLPVSYSVLTFCCSVKELATIEEQNNQKHKALALTLKHWKYLQSDTNLLF